MNHFYQNIPGYFDFQEVYTEFVRQAKDGTRFVEVGAWYGKSTAFLAVEIVNSGKAIQFDCIDTWEGSPEMKDRSSGAYDTNLAKYGTIYPFFLMNMLPVYHVVNPIKCASVEAAAKYPDQSLDYVFIDAEHSYEAVTKDIEAWYPKVKAGGTIAGHDYYSWPEVNRAVNEYFGIAVSGKGTCWIHIKNS